MRGQFGWKTIWIDLTAPEEIKVAGEYKGMASKDLGLRGLQFMGSVKDTRRLMQGAGRRIWLGRARFTKEAVHLDWDQQKAPYKWTPGGDFAFSYPLTVTNRLNRPVTAVLSLLPFQAVFAHGGLAQDRVALQPGETKTVDASVVLPGNVAVRERPLYCEAFEARACAEGIPDSEVTILRSSDPIHLTVTVPIPEEKLGLPFLPRRKDLPESVTEFPAEGRKVAQELAESASPADLDQAPPDKPVLDAEAATRYKQGLSSAAFLYDYTGDKKYLAKATELLLRLAELYPKKQAEWAKKPVRRISDGIVTGNTLGFGFTVGGTQRPPYLYSLGGNSRCGVMHGVMNNFDLVSADMPADARQKIIQDFLLPAGIQIRNHYFGPGNQQSTVNYVILYAGLITRNWPLVSFAYSSEHGLLGNMNWAFDDDGLCLEGHYQTYTINPMLWTLELLYHRGIDHYDRRFYDIVHSRGAGAINMAYGYPIREFLDQQRFAGKPFLKELPPASDGYHLSGSTLLRWQDFEVSMNWGTHIMRGARDRCALWIRPPKDKRDWLPLAAGGGQYTHDSFSQSIIILDESLQDPVPAEIVSVDVEGPVQHVMAASDKHYPGTTITRTFALLDHHVLVVDRVSSNQPRTVDWRLNGAGTAFSLPTEEKHGSWTEKPDDKSLGATFGAGVKSHQYAKTDGTWREGGGRLTMLGEPNTEIMTSIDGQKRPMLTVRRRNSKLTDFVALFSLEAESLERVPVKRADGAEADAVGVRVALKAGKTFQVIVSYEKAGTEVVLGNLKTTARFATDVEN
jgi:hypothetical protein